MIVFMTYVGQVWQNEFHPLNILFLKVVCNSSTEAEAGGPQGLLASLLFLESSGPMRVPVLKNNNDGQVVVTPLF